MAYSEKVFGQKIIQILQNDVINLRWILNAGSGNVIKEREGSLNKSHVIIRAEFCQDVSTSKNIKDYQEQPEAWSEAWGRHPHKEPAC